METDWALGEVLAALDKAGIANNTLVMFTSDNGCSPAAKVDELESKGHFPSELRRGYKADIWDGGHRIPFIVRWPDRIKAGGRTDQLTCLTDLLATLTLGFKLHLEFADVLTSDTSSSRFSVGLLSSLRLHDVASKADDRPCDTCYCCHQLRTFV